MMLIRLFVLVCCITLLNGCASISKGVAQALLEREREDVRLCQITGQPFQGLFPLVKDPTGTTKVLMVHGVGSRVPGYSTQLQERLSNKMALNNTSKITKNIELTNFNDTDKTHGNLRITRLTNEDKSHELLFYELTWSAITENEKALLSFDNSGKYSSSRTAINDRLKMFVNNAIPDPLIYLGDRHEDILRAFTLSFCWMVSREKWDDLPVNSNQACDLAELHSKSVSMRNDHYAFISHSLGSRIVIDGLQHIASSLGDKQKRTEWDPADKFVQAFRELNIPIFMLANQLPLLQLGRKLPDVTGESDAYCLAEGEHYDSRILNKTDIIAFSDPNDLLSYAIPYGFTDSYIDSRLCVDATNININVANIIDVFGMGLTNPLEAHVAYRTDERVIALMVNGVGNENTSPIINERCRTLKTDD